MLAKNFPFIHTKIYLDILEVMSPEEMKNMTSSEIAKHAQDLIQANLDAHIDRKRLPRKMK